MILQQLCTYYERLVSDPSVEIGSYGFSFQKVQFVIVLTKEGQLFDIHDIRSIQKKKALPRKMLLPDCGTRTSGVKAQFLWDKASYMLGFEAEGSKPERVQQELLATKNQYDSIFSQIQNKNLQIICKFYDSLVSSPLTLSEDQKNLLHEVGTGFGVYKIQGEQSYIHEDQELHSWWETNNSQNMEGEIGQCLVLGSFETLARIHPNIKGVKDAQSSGASIVSFNNKSFISYEKDQSYNAPISEKVAFKYTTALNKLLEKESAQNMVIGNTTLIFWSEQPSITESIFGFSFNDSTMSEDTERNNEIRNIFQKIKDGLYTFPNKGTPFYILGLAPNASRLSIRYWFVDTVEGIMDKVVQHQKRLEIAGTNENDSIIPIWKILSETARESKEIPPLLAGSLTRSILLNTRYPDMLLQAVMRRIKADKNIRATKAAIIKAYLIKNYDIEVQTMLDEENPEISYQIGRLFAVLEKIQKDASPNINATIKDRYFSSASANPVVAFPRLTRLSQHHLNKLDIPHKINHEKRLQSIMSKIDSFPSHLTLKEQGLFVLGYYQQMQQLYTKKEK